MTLQNRETDSDWLSAIAAPLANSPCGEDPRYLEEFQQVKEEMDKLREVDYALITASCRDLLGRVAKDLRLGGYHLVAATYIDGLPGLLDGLSAYRTLLEHFWENCHPQNETGRRAALNLLGNPRLLAFAEQKESEASGDIFGEILQQAQCINAFLVDKLGEEAPRLTGLGHWLEERLRRLEPPPEKPGHTPKTEPEPAPSQPKVELPSEVTSEQNLEALTRQIHRYLCNTGDWLRGMAYSRAFRWGKLTLPPHEGGRTRIPAPRPAGLIEFEKALTDGSPERILTCSENLFFEPGFQLMFDLQFRTHQSLEGSQKQDLARFLRDALTNLLERHPQLPELQYEDGTPFAGPECRQWLQQCRREGRNGKTSSAQKGEGEVETSTAVIGEAMQLAKQKKLPEALETIRDLPVKNEKQRVRKRLTEARICLTAGKASMAEVVLAELQRYIRNHHLATWDPGLAVEVLQQRLAALQYLEKSGPSANRQDTEQQAREVRQLICQIDVIAAATLI